MLWDRTEPDTATDILYSVPSAFLLVALVARVYVYSSSCLVMSCLGSTTRPPRLHHVPSPVVRLVLALMPSALRRRPRCNPREPSKLLLVGRAQLRVHRRKRRLLARELLVKVARVRRVADRREVRRRDAFVEHVVKVDVLEEKVALDVFRVGFARAKSSQRVSREELASALLTMRPCVSDSPAAGGRRRPVAS